MKDFLIIVPSSNKYVWLASVHKGKRTPWEKDGVQQSDVFITELCNTTKACASITPSD